VSFNGNFTIGVTSVASQIVLTDVSAGSDPNLTDRTINLYKTDNSAPVAAIDWPIGQSSITISPLDKDYALNVSVVWTSSSPLAPPSTYTKSLIYAFVGYGQQYANTLLQFLATNQQMVSDQSWYFNFTILLLEIQNAQNAISVGANLGNAQAAILRYQLLLTNANDVF
jgi:hypothetical protein